MTSPENYSFIRYLSAKKNIDDRSLNRHVWLKLKESVPVCFRDKPLRALEVGAGIGTMLERMLDWGLLQYVEYTALDAQQELITHAHDRLSRWSLERGYQAHVASPGELILSDSHHHVKAEFITATLSDFLSQLGGEIKYDLLVAHAFLDLVNVPLILPSLLDLLTERGHFYFTINFDGITHFEPELDSELDEQIQSLYHRTMDERLINGKPSGHSHTGRQMFSHLKDHNADILAAGSSDWVVHPVAGEYMQDDAYFLHYIIHTIHGALQGHPGLDPTQFAWWVDKRHAQIDRGILTYLTHQLDFVGRSTNLTQEPAR